MIKSRSDHDTPGLRTLHGSQLTSPYCGPQAPPDLVLSSLWFPTHSVPTSWASCQFLGPSRHTPTSGLCPGCSLCLKHPPPSSALQPAPPPSGTPSLLHWFFLNRSQYLLTATYFLVYCVCCSLFPCSGKTETEIFVCLIHLLSQKSGAVLGTL